MRVQFSVNETEWKKLQVKAEREGYPDVPTFCKDIALGDRTYAKLWDTVVEKISKMESNEIFTINGLVDTPPANLGVKLYRHQKSLGIEFLKKDNLNTNQYIKK